MIHYKWCVSLDIALMLALNNIVMNQLVKKATFGKRTNGDENCTKVYNCLEMCVSKYNGTCQDAILVASAILVSQ